MADMIDGKLSMVQPEASTAHMGVGTTIPSTSKLFLIALMIRIPQDPLLTKHPRESRICMNRSYIDDSFQGPRAVGVITSVRSSLKGPSTDTRRCNGMHGGIDWTSQYQKAGAKFIRLTVVWIEGKMCH